MELNFEKTKVLIIGDVMLDQYWFGGTSRISPEAPVPVVSVDRIDERPGGAANVALGVKALGASPMLLGITGKDSAALRLEHLLSTAAVSFELNPIDDCNTITKLRILSRNQQMIRLDTEKHFPPQAGIVLKEKYCELLNEYQVVVLSDYGKGTLFDPNWFIAQARERGVPVVVDPKSRDFSIYRHATVLKPNLKEFEAVVGECKTEEILVAKASLFLSNHDIGALVISRSEKGLSVITKEGHITHIPTEAREVHDVTGAGDTVVGVMATALASGMTLTQAAKLGNIAAGIAVGKLGAAIVTIPEIHDSLRKETSLTTGMMSEEALLEAVRFSKARGERIVFTNGCFDILHAGHVLYLEQAKSLGDRVIVGVNDNASVSRLKGPSRPINALADRMAVLAGLKSVDWVVPFSEDTPERLIQCIEPDILVKGGDYNDISAIPGAKFVLESGGEVQLLDLKEGCSTTNVIKAIALQNNVVTESA